MKKSIRHLKNSLGAMIFCATLCACSPTESAPLHIDQYASSVSDTAPFLITGLSEGEKVDYVISSYPVIFSAWNNPNRKTNLSIYENVGASFGAAFSFHGFPQAGLFVKEEIVGTLPASLFLQEIGLALDDLVLGAKNAVSYMNSYSEDANLQQARFGFASPALSGSQENNGLAFLKEDNQPSQEELFAVSKKLGITLEKEDLSSFYSYGVRVADAVFDSSSVKVVCPLGAPSALLAKYASDLDHITITSPANVQSAFQKGEADFIIFDSVNGAKLAKANGGKYKLVRMLTYGDLYVMSTGNDENGVMEDDDFILSYGEGLIPDLVFKALHQ